MVAAVRRGASFRCVARQFRVSARTVFKWFHRACGKRLDRVLWEDRPRGNPRPKNQTPAHILRRILQLRATLKKHSALGEYGAAAIARQLHLEKLSPVPAVRSIARILSAHGLVESARRRQPPPPPGWYLPALREGGAELDSFDFVEGLALQGGRQVEVFNAISLYGSLAASSQRSAFTTTALLSALPAHWQRFGQPHFAQFDNDTRFQGSHSLPNRLGRVVHLCLCLGIIPVFAPPRETGFQAKIESFNDLWQRKVWHRWRHPSLPALRRRSQAFIGAHQQRHAARIEAAPPRAVLVSPRPHTCLQPLVIFVRRTNDRGHIRLLETSLPVDVHWPNRLVRCELDVLTEILNVYALRRRDPTRQPLLHSTPLKVKLTPWHQP
jgi:transposase